MKTLSDSNPSLRIAQPAAETSGWIEIPFDEAFEDATSLGTKIPQGAFLQRGRFPIIDQGEDFIAGYSNEESAAWPGKLPVIIFGDHTRALKFVDFRFVLGADGCKVLLPREMIDPKFAYYHLRHIDLEGAGYSRHFKFLKETTVRFPSIATQGRIAERLELADRLCRTRRYALELTENFLPAVFLEFFGDRHRAASEYPTKPLEEIVQPDRGITYGIVQAGPHIPDGVPYIKTGDIIDGVICADGLSRTAREIADSYQRSEVKFGDLVMSIRATVGTVAVLPETLDGANLTQGTARIAPGPEVDKLFLLWQIRMPETQRWISQQIKGTTFLEITLGRLREMPVFVPPLPIQQKFATLVQRMDRLRAMQREALRQAEHLFASLLHHAFSV